MDQFIQSKSWFDKKYKDKSSCRYFTFKAALNLLKQTGGPNIVETGTTRLKDDWGAGMSTILFSDFLMTEKVTGGRLWTVDILPEAITACKGITVTQKEFIEYVVDDSLHFLEHFDKKINLLYLDSFDYPYGELLNLYGGKDDIDKAVRILNDKTDKEILSDYEAVVSPCQEHQLKELKLALPKMEEVMGIVLLDDNDLPGGGKSRLSKKYLTEIGATCILDSQQSLWLL